MLTEIKELFNQVLLIIQIFKTYQFLVQIGVEHAQTQSFWISHNARRDRNSAESHSIQMDRAIA